MPGCTDRPRPEPCRAVLADTLVPRGIFYVAAHAHTLIAAHQVLTHGFSLTVVRLLRALVDVCKNTSAQCECGGGEIYRHGDRERDRETEGEGERQIERKRETQTDR